MRICMVCFFILSFLAPNLYSSLGSNRDVMAPDRHSPWNRALVKVSRRKTRRCTCSSFWQKTFLSFKKCVDRVRFRVSISTSMSVGTPNLGEPDKVCSWWEWAIYQVVAAMPKTQNKKIQNHKYKEQKHKKGSWCEWAICAVGSNWPANDVSTAWSSSGHSSKKHK